MLLLSLYISYIANTNIIYIYTYIRFYTVGTSVKNPVRKQENRVKLKMANINVEKFIEDIYERPNIWNRSYAGNKQYLDETWNELSQIHQLGSKYTTTCSIHKKHFHTHTYTCIQKRVYIRRCFAISTKKKLITFIY